MIYVINVNNLGIYAVYIKYIIYIYAKLSKERPEGHVMLNEQEKAEFEDWLGV